MLLNDEGGVLLVVQVDSIGPAAFDKSTMWRKGLPTLRDARVTLRELKMADAPALLEQISTPHVLQYLATSPATVEGFERFIRWTRVQRRRRAHICFAIVPAGESKPVGLMQAWPIEPDFSTAEWGFVVAASRWGTGLFIAAAQVMLDFTFGTLGVWRLEARAAVTNGRGNGVLRKLGATPEGTLRRASRCGDSFTDHVMWSLLADEWMLARRRRPLTN